ncbi:hypothetical protein DF186_15055, partial [Enterococcus hirae]
GDVVAVGTGARERREQIEAVDHLVLGHRLLRAAEQDQRHQTRRVEGRGGVDPDHDRGRQPRDEGAQPLGAAAGGAGRGRAPPVGLDRVGELV